MGENMNSNSFQIVNEWLHLLIPILSDEEMAEVERILVNALDRTAGYLEGEDGAGIAQNLAQFGMSVLGNDFWLTDLGRLCIPYVWLVEDDKPLTFRQAAALMGVPTATVQREIARGHLSRFGTAVSRASVGRWLLNRDVEAK